MRLQLIALSALLFNIQICFTQISDTLNRTINFVETENMVQGDYRVSSAYFMPDSSVISGSGLNLIAFPDSSTAGFMSAQEIRVKLDCPDCIYTGPLYDSDKAKRILVCLINSNDSAEKIMGQDGKLRIIQEGKNLNGEWEPIEYWQNSSCGNSYFPSIVVPGKSYVSVSGYRYTGGYETELRFKLNTGSSIIYSNTFTGKIHYNQFTKPSKPMFGLTFF